MYRPSTAPRQASKGGSSSASPSHDQVMTKPDQEPTLFLMVGLPGAGKTARARELAAEHRALLMTPDAWMLSLFDGEQPAGKRDQLEGLLIALATAALR